MARLGVVTVKKGSKESQILAFMATAVSALVSILAFGALTGGAELARRNHRDLLTWAVILVLAGVAVGYLGTTLQGIPETILLAIGLVMAIVGLSLAAVAVFDRGIGRPGISANLADGSKRLVATVDTGGLASDEEVQILITAEPGSVDLYRSIFGPDPSGDVKRTVEFPLRAIASYERVLIRAWPTGALPGDCQVLANVSEKSHTGCAAVHLPPTNPRPQLTAHWEDGTLAAKVASTGVGNENAVAVRIVARARSKALHLYGANLAPEQGIVSQEIKLAVPSGFRTVCAEAKIVPSESTKFAQRGDWRDSCPRNPTGVSWVRLAVTG
jgi:hypothetical protein